MTPENSSRRHFLKAGSAVLTLLVTPVAFGAAESRIIAVRVWPADDYTRVTLEAKEELHYTHQIVKNPERLVIDLEGVEFNSVIGSLPSQITGGDPYIKLIRAGRNRPGIVRLVIELKSEIKPQVFTLPPAGNYGNRLVMDLYPAQPIDPLLALLDKSNAPAGDNSSTSTPALTPPNPTAEAPPSPQKPAHQPETADSEDAPAKPARKNSGGKKPGARVITVALDPGHGGEDPGATGPRGTHEKTVVLSIARKLKTKIDAEPNMRAMLTRDEDFFVPLQQRVVKARRVQADMFMSIHADAFTTPEARGSSVFVLSERGASSTAAKWLAAKENASDLIGGVNIATKDNHLARTLLDLSQTATLNDSLKVGKSVLGEIGGINKLHKGEVEEAGFAVLKAPDIPSILVETAFISNPEEESKLMTDAYQDKMADALLRGIKRYFAKNPPLAKSNLAKLDN